MSDTDLQPRSPDDRRTSDELVLAAVERGTLHRQPARTPVALWSVLEQLCVPRRSAEARHIRARMAVLHDAGGLLRSRRHGVSTWELSDAGARRLARARREGRMPALPESPQHRAWRAARTSAAQELERFRARLRAALVHAEELLVTDTVVPSDAWFELGEELAHACWRVGSASHCLYEWPEPSDARADIDDHTSAADRELDPTARARARARRRGRRNVRLW